MRDELSSCPFAVHDLGKKAGVVLGPASPTELIEYVLHLCDVILASTVNPGFGGQKFLPEMLPKIRRLRQLCNARGLNPVIEVDGGQNCDRARQVKSRSCPVRHHAPAALPFLRKWLRRFRTVEMVSIS